MMEHEATGTQTRLAKTMARKGCKALGPRCGNGLGKESGHGHGVQVFNCPNKLGMEDLTG